MKVINWNVLNDNLFLKQGINYIFKQSPDVICLQEFPNNKMSLLENRGYSKYSNYDFYCDIEEKSWNLVILSKTKIRYAGVIKYYDKIPNSLHHRIYYRRILKVNQIPNAIIAKIVVGEKSEELYVANTHLYCSVGPRERIQQLKNIFAQLKGEKFILCGDLNIFNHGLFTKLTGWFCGYTAEDRMYDEHSELEKFFETNAMINIFKNSSTTSREPILGKQQFDYVVIPNDMQIIDKKLLGSFGSDHKILSVELS